ncbi:MAG: beta-sandwich domain-containing protein [Gemmatimonadota bacterium]
MRRNWIEGIEGAGLLAALALAVGACGGAAGDARETAAETAPLEEASTPEPGVESASSYTVVEVTNGGTIRGTVRFVGAVPAPQTITVTEDAETCGGLRQVETLRVGGNKGLADAVVSLVDIASGAALEMPTSPPVLDQRECGFRPHVLFAPAGATVEVLNSDPIMHNVHTLTFENRPLNRAQPPGVRKIDVTFRVPEKVKVGCDVHDWMGAWIVVIDHPYHALTDRDGNFVIEDVPPGTYTLEAWHEALGASSHTVTVTSGETTSVSLEMSKG